MHPVTVPLTLTRRRLLGNGLAAGGAIVLGHAGPVLGAGRRAARDAVFATELPASGRGSRRLAGWVIAPPVPAPRRFDLVGVEWPEPRPGGAQLRVRRGGGHWSPWVEVSGDRGHAPDGPTVPREISDPVWAGGADVVQLRATHPWSQAVLHFVDVGGGEPQGPHAPGAATAALGSADRPLAQPVLNAGPGQPPIIARRGWTRGRFLPNEKPEYGRIKLAFVHHTQSANAYGPGQSAAMVLSIAHYHRDVRGWHDIGYNFLIDRYGQIFEGSAGGIDEAVVGAQAGGYNLVSTGVGMLGSFQGAAPPRAALRALVRLLGWKLSLHGLPMTGEVTVHVSAAGAGYSRYPAGAPVTLKRISGHRDGDSTDCPGNALYHRLPALRQRVDALAVARAVLTLAGAPSTTTPGAVSLTGRLTLASGTPIAQATVSVQSRTSGGETTVATATTVDDGTWSATVPLPGRVRLRALYAGDAGHPAAISDPLEGALTTAPAEVAPNQG